MFSLEESEAEQLTSAFSMVGFHIDSPPQQQQQSDGVSSSSVSTTIPMIIKLVVPEFKSKEERESDATEYENQISTTIEIALPQKQRKEGGSFIFRNLSVVCLTNYSSSEKEKEKEQEQNNSSSSFSEILSHMYTEILKNCCDEPDDFESSPFSVSKISRSYQQAAQADHQKTKLSSGAISFSSNSLLMSLVVQMLTDATDSQLTDTLAAAELASKKHYNSSNNTSRKRTNSNYAASGSFSNENSNKNEDDDDNNNEQQQHCNNHNKKSTTTATISDLIGDNNNNSSTSSTTLRMRIGKIDHMRNQSMYLKRLTEFSESVVSEGLVKAIAVLDPVTSAAADHMPRVLLAIISLVPENFASSSSSSCSATSSSTSSPLSTDYVEAGSTILKYIRTEIVDEDSHGRKVRERMMTDLGSFDITIPKTSSNQVEMFIEKNLAIISKNFVPLEKRSMSNGEAALLTASPTTREDGILLLRKILAEPFIPPKTQKPSVHHHGTYAENEAPWIKTVTEILSDKKIWNHV